MKAEQYSKALEAAYGAVFALRGLPLADMLSAARRAEAVGPVVDPTLYRLKGEALSQDIKVLEACRRLQQDLRSLIGGAE